MRVSTGFLNIIPNTFTLSISKLLRIFAFLGIGELLLYIYESKINMKISLLSLFLIKFLWFSNIKLID